jgi:hypothetical protein
MRLRIPALLVLALMLTPCLEAGLFSSNKKKLPKPIKMIDIRRHDAKRLANPTKLSAKYGPSWGRPNELLYAPQRLHMNHSLTDDSYQR